MKVGICVIDSMKVIRYKHGEIVAGGDKHIEATLSKSGEYQDHLVMWSNEAKNKNVAIDVGANIGAMTIAFSKTYGTVYSFEPSTKAFAYLKKNIDHNGSKNVIAINKGLSSTSSKLILYEDSANPSFSSIHDKVGKPREVEVITLDSMDIQSVSFIKVDIQRHESEFIKGALETLKRCRPLIALELPERDEQEKKEYQTCRSLLESVNFVQITRKKKDVLFGPA